MSSNLTISTVVRLKSMATKVDVSRKRNSAVLRKQNMHIENCIENKQKICLRRYGSESDSQNTNAKIVFNLSRTSGYITRSRKRDK